MRRLFGVAAIHFALSWFVWLGAGTASLSTDPVTHCVGMVFFWAHFCPILSLAWLYGDLGEGRRDEGMLLLAFALNSMLWASFARMGWHYGSRLVRAVRRASASKITHLHQN